MAWKTINGSNFEEDKSMQYGILSILWTVLLHKCVANVLLYICVCRGHGDGRLVLIVPEDIHSYLKVNVR